MQSGEGRKNSPAELERTLRAAPDGDGQSGLLPCPFDGATPEIGSMVSLGRTFYWVACSCSAQGPESQNKLRAISKWNTRAAILEGQ